MEILTFIRHASSPDVDYTYCLGNVELVEFSDAGDAIDSAGDYQKIGILNSLLSLQVWELSDLFNFSHCLNLLDKPKRLYMFGIFRFLT